MKIAPFALGRYFARHEFTARYLLSSSDCEALQMSELLAMADSETRRMWDGLRLGYTESLGHPVLRDAVSDVYDGIEPNEVLVVVPEEGIFLLMHALLEPGDHVVCTFPAYQSLHEVSRSIGCEVSTWEPDEERGWRFDLGELEQMLRADTKLVVANFPHNPTGTIPSKEDFGALVDMVRRRGIYLLTDEMFRFLEVEEGATLPSGCELYERAISLFGLSKTFGLPGLRMGWVVSRNRELLERMAILKDYTTICHNAPSEILAIIALRNRDTIIDRQLKRVHRNIAVLESFFSDYGDCLRWNRPVGSSICFPRLLVEETASVFCEELVRETGIMLVPSSLFHFGDNHVRIGFGREDMPEVIRRFASYLDRCFR
jgi:aspartate/methionine/tyrosine aminotransferase